MKVHIGIDSQSGLVQSASVTAAIVHDSQQLPICCMVKRAGCMATVPIGEKISASGSSNCPRAQDFTNKRAA
jgi:IS5 family transposase